MTMQDIKVMGFEAGFKGCKCRQSSEKSVKIPVGSVKQKERLLNFSRLVRGTERRAK